jgi:integration host factor subunit beta
MTSEQTVAKRLIADRIADKLNLPQGVALQVVQAFLDEMIEELAKGNRIEFRDFGVFELVVRQPRIALNPKTLEKVPVPRRTVVKFRPGRLLKGRVREIGISNANEPPPATPPAQP